MAVESLLAPDTGSNLDRRRFQRVRLSLLGRFMLENQWFAAMDSAHEHKFSFNEAVSFIVSCDDQTEIDYYWQKLSAVAASEQCAATRVGSTLVLCQTWM